MKLLASLSIALASSALAAAAPAEPISTETAESRTAIPIRNLELARQFVAAAEPGGDTMGSIREYAILAASRASDDPDDEEAQKAVEQRVDKLLARAEPTIRKLMPAMAEAYAYAYAREFSAEELEQLIAFVQSPAGKHYAKRQAFVESDDAILQIHQTIGEELEPIMRDIAKEMCAQRAAERLAAGDTNAKCPLSEESETMAG